MPARAWRKCRVMQAFTHEDAAAARFGAGGRAVLRRGQCAGQGARRTYRHRHLPRLCQRGRRAVVRRAGRAVGTHDRRQARRSSCSMRVLAATAVGGLSEVWGEVAPMHGRGRAPERAARRSSRRSNRRAIRSRCPSRRAARSPSATCPSPIRCGPRRARSIGVSFHVAPGERVALVGPSGAGKTTIFALLLRFYDADRGKVEIDGVPVNEAELAELRAPLRAGAARDGAVRRHGRRQYRLWRGARRAGARSKPRPRPPSPTTSSWRCRKATTPCSGEGGVTLSAGQRQRIAIARAVLRNAPILLLDEATSALDSESETLVQKALDKIMEGRTTLVIAHRLATVIARRPHPGARPWTAGRGGHASKPDRQGRRL